MRPAGSPKQLEERRRYALSLMDEGVAPLEVCRRVRCSRSSLQRWEAARETGGSAALAPVPAAGRPRKLSARQEARLLTYLQQGAEQHGFDTALWTQQRVVALIETKFGVGYHHDSIGRMLHRLGWSVQKPERVAAERDEAAIAHWRRHLWPAVKKKPRR